MRFFSLNKYLHIANENEMKKKCNNIYYFLFGIHVYPRLLCFVGDGRVIFSPHFDDFLIRHQEHFNINNFWVAVLLLYFIIHHNILWKINVISYIKLDIIVIYHYVG